jgi:hypothetical protein
MNMTKENVKNALGLKTDTDLAEFFNIYPQAVSLWGDNKPIPIRRQLELHISHPKLFKAPAPKIQANRKRAG